MIPNKQAQIQLLEQDLDVIFYWAEQTVVLMVFGPIIKYNK